MEEKIKIKRGKTEEKHFLKNILIYKMTIKVILFQQLLI